MTEHPGEQFPPDVDPDVEPGFDPYPSEETPQAPDYDTEPAPQDLTPEQPHATTADESYGGEAVEHPYAEAAAEQPHDDEAPNAPYGEQVQAEAVQTYGGDFPEQSYDGGVAGQSFGEEASGDSYGGVGGEVESEAVFEASLGEMSATESHAEPGAESVGGHVDPAEVEFGPEFARAPGEEHEHSFVAESAAAESAVAESAAGEAAVGEPVAEAGSDDPAEVGVPEFADADTDDPVDDAVPEFADGVADFPVEDVVAVEEVPDEERAHPLVEETMGRLDELRDRPVGEHAEVYADLHERLQSALVEADADPGDRG